MILAISSTGPALAATVNVNNGQVLLNRGDGYRLVAGPTQGKAGDMVVANPGSNGQIVYPDGCVVEVLPGTAVTIAAESPCQTGLFPNATTFAIGAVVVGGGVAAAVLLSQSDKSASP